MSFKKRNKSIWGCMIFRLGLFSMTSKEKKRIKVCAYNGKKSLERNIFDRSIYVFRRAGAHRRYVNTGVQKISVNHMLSIEGGGRNTKPFAEANSNERYPARSNDYWMPKKRKNGSQFVNCLDKPANRR